MKSVYDHLKEAIDDYVSPAVSRVLYGPCNSWEEYIRCSTEVRTAENLLGVIKDALKRLEEIENGSSNAD